MQQAIRRPQFPATIPPVVVQAARGMHNPARLSADVKHSERGMIGVSMLLKTVGRLRINYYRTKSAL